MSAIEDAIVSSSGGKISGEVFVPSDKSVTHRAILMASICQGKSHLTSWLKSKGIFSTLSCIKACGINFTQDTKDGLILEGKGINGLSEPVKSLDCGGAGTTMRLLCGIMAGQRFSSTLDGNTSLCARPMQRVTIPLRNMGATVTDTSGHAPVFFKPSFLKGIEHQLVIPSAQVKSAILFAGLYANGRTSIIENGISRNYTEKMLCDIGAKIDMSENKITLTPGGDLSCFEIAIPGDPSTAAFILAAAQITGGEVLVKNIETSKGRTGFFEVLEKMGSEIKMDSNGNNKGIFEESNIWLKSGYLHGVSVQGEYISRSIDEFPLLMVLATQAEGDTVVTGASELRFKESDRIAVMSSELRKLGAVIKEFDDGFIISGPVKLYGNEVESFGDHRVAMALAVAGFVAEGETIIHNSSCISESFPGFVEIMKSLGARVSRKNYV